MSDTGSRAIPVAERKAGSDLWRLIEQRQTDAVILGYNDRTARNKRVLEYLLLKAHIYDHDAELHYADTG